MAGHIPSLFPSLLQLLWVSIFVLAGLIHSGTERRSGAGNPLLPQQPAVSLAQLHRNPPATGAIGAHVCKLPFSQCTHQHTWFPAMLFLRSCGEVEGIGVQDTLCYESA